MTKLNSKIKLLNNSSFVTLIFAILKFWNFEKCLRTENKIEKILKKRIKG